MPMDSEGQYRHNHESAAMHSKQAGKEYKPEGEKPAEGEGDHVEIHPHGDGTFHTMHQGEQVEHATHGHALIHAAKVHAEEGHKHFMAHHDGGEMHTHSVKDGEEPESRDGEDGHQHLDEAMGDGGEADHDEDPLKEDQQPAGAGLGGLY